GPTTGPWLVQTACGLAPSPVDSAPYLARSHGRETTFQRDIGAWDEVRREVVRLAHQVAAEITTEQRPAIRVVVKVRYVPFFTRTHGQALAAPATAAAPIETAALAALGQFTQRRPVRLLEVRAEFAQCHGGSPLAGNARGQRSPTVRDAPAAPPPARPCAQSAW